jgi:hypothetical protein
MYGVECTGCIELILSSTRLISCCSTISADRVIWCTGSTVSTPYMRTFFGHIIDPFGKIKARLLQPLGGRRCDSVWPPMTTLLTPCSHSRASSCECCVCTRGQVVRTMHVVGSTNVFAGGDVCMRYAFEEKSVRTALRHASVISTNIIRQAQGESAVEHSEERGIHKTVVSLGFATGAIISVRLQALLSATAWWLALGP